MIPFVSVVGEDQYNRGKEKSADGNLDFTPRLSRVRQKDSVNGLFHFDILQEQQCPVVSRATLVHCYGNKKTRFSSACSGTTDVVAG